MAKYVLAGTSMIYSFLRSHFSAVHDCIFTWCKLLSFRLVTFSQFNSCSGNVLCWDCVLIKESVDYLCRDMAPTRNLKQKPYNFTRNTLKACLSTQASLLSGFVISKTHKWPKATRKTAKHKCAVMKVPFFVFFLVKTTMFNNDISQTV